MTSLEALTADGRFAELLPFLTEDEQRELLGHMTAVNVPRMGFREFVRNAWRVVQPSVPYIHNWHIDAIVEHLEAVTWGQIQNLIINIPPRHMKSLLVGVIWQAWVWSFRPSSQWLFVSHSGELSVRDNVRARRIIRSPFYQEAFGDIYQLAGDQNLKKRFENNMGGHRIAFGVGGSTGDGGDFIVADDLLSIDARHSLAKREAGNDFWGTTITTRRNSPKTSSAVIVAQRLHERDVVGYVKAKEAEGGEYYDMLVIPAEFEKPRPPTLVGWVDPRKEFGELLWEDRFPRRIIEGMKVELGEQASAQLQQRPTSSGGNVFRRSWLKFWRPSGSSFPPVRLRNEDGSWVECSVVDLPVTFDRQIQSWDMAFKGLATSSFVVGQVWGVNGVDRFLVDQIRARMNAKQTIDAVERLSEAWPNTKTKVVEDKANGTAVVNMLEDKLLGLTLFSPSGGKIARANAVVPEFASGHVFLPHPAIYNWVNDYIEELTQFPTAPNDDQIDATTQALNFLYNFDKRPTASAWGR